MIKLQTIYSTLKHHLYPKYDLELIHSLKEYSLEEWGPAVGVGKSFVRGYAVGTLTGTVAGNIALLAGADPDFANEIAQGTGTAILGADLIQVMCQIIYDKFINMEIKTRDIDHTLEFRIYSTQEIMDLVDESSDKKSVEKFLEHELTRLRPDPGFPNNSAIVLEDSICDSYTPERLTENAYFVEMVGTNGATVLTEKVYVSRGFNNRDDLGKLLDSPLIPEQYKEPILNAFDNELFEKNKLAVTVPENYYKWLSKLDNGIKRLTTYPAGFAGGLLGISPWLAGLTYLGFKISDLGTGESLGPGESIAAIAFVLSIPVIGLAVMGTLASKAAEFGYKLGEVISYKLNLKP